MVYKNINNYLINQLKNIIMVKINFKIARKLIKNDYKGLHFMTFIIKMRDFLRYEGF